MSLFERCTAIKARNAIASVASMFRIPSDVSRSILRFDYDDSSGSTAVPLVVAHHDRRVTRCELPDRRFVTFPVPVYRLGLLNEVARCSEDAKPHRRESNDLVGVRMRRIGIDEKLVTREFDGLRHAHSQFGEYALKVVFDVENADRSVPVFEPIGSKSAA